MDGEPVFALVTQASTQSRALDRVTKRGPALDGIVRRVGTGRGVTIYVFDGGIADNHEELAGRLRIGFDAFPTSPRICNAHGTAVAGAAAGATLGVAPAAEIVDVKIINCERMRGSVRAIVAAAQWTAADHAKHPGQAAIANWSFVVDTVGDVPAIDSAVVILHDAGMLVVASAGNFDVDACRVSPGNAPGTFVVGASALVRTAGGVLWRDVRVPNTAWGPCVDLYAPGDEVLLPSVEHGHPTSTSWSGTSMAAGFASGAAALLLERMPSTVPEQLAELLKRRATRNVLDEQIVVASAVPASVRTTLLYAGPTSRP
ncbi:MAG: peptidase and in kexin sedolisin [Gemmatimonadetes bacterium]|nr:peptidase and in kexin sedolisin [Gemmatimonadota bacterium]